MKKIFLILFLAVLLTACSLTQPSKPTNDNLNQEIPANTNLNNGLNTNVNETPSNTDGTACKNLCGDTVCQEIVCLALGCPCAETPESCPQDCQKSETSNTGIISGKVTIGPFCPVEQEGVPCPVPTEAYTSRKILIYDQSGNVIIQEQNLNPNGTFAFSLPVGTYVVDLPANGIERSLELPQTVTVKVNETVNLEISIDTGIR